MWDKSNVVQSVKERFREVYVLFFPAFFGCSSAPNSRSGVPFTQGWVRVQRILTGAEQEYETLRPNIFERRSKSIGADI